MSLSIFTIDSQLIIRSWDEQLATMTGITAKVAQGRSLMEFAPDLVDRGLMDRLTTVLTEGKIDVIPVREYHYLFPCLPLVPTPYFSYMQQQIIVAPLKKGTNIVGLVITVEDVTQRLSDEQEWLSLNDVKPEAIIDDSSAKEEMIKPLGDEHWQVRAKAVHHYLEQVDRQNTQELIDLFRREHRNPSILNSILQIFAHINIDPVPALVECLTDNDTDLRIYSALALGERMDVRAIPALVSALEDPDPNVRYHAIDALGHLKAVSAVDKLGEIAQSGDFFLAFSAFDALLRIGDLSVANRLLTLLPNLSNWQVRQTAVDHLSEQNNPELMSSLLRCLREQHRNPNILNSVLQVLSLSKVDPVPVLIECLKEQDTDLRIYAALTLGERHDERAIPALRECLSDSDPNVQFHAIEALAQLRAFEAMEDLIALAQSGDFFLAFPALTALGQVANPQEGASILPDTCMEQLIPLLDDPLLAAQTAETLGQTGDAQVSSALAKRLNDPESPIRELTIAISQIYERYEHLSHEGDHILHLAHSALTSQGIDNLLNAIPTATPTELSAIVLLLRGLEGRSIEIALAQLLKYPRVRQSVMTALIRYGTRVTDLLIAQLNPDDVETCQAAVIALGQIGSWQAVPALMALLKTNSWDIADSIPTFLVMSIAHSLAQIGDRSAFESLLSLLGHPESAVRLSAIAGLNSLGHPAMPEHIAQLLKDYNPHIRESAVKIAGYFAYDNCVPLLLEMINDPDERVRRAVVENLPNLDHPQVLSLIISILQKDNPTIRATCAHALGEFPQFFQAVTALLSALQDQDAWVRYQAVRSLKRFPSELLPEDCFNSLRSLIESDPATQVRASAVEVLGFLKPDYALPVLIHLTESQQEDRDTTRTALIALGRIPRSEVIPPLLNALNSPVPERRMDVVQAFQERQGEEAGVALQWIAGSDTDPRVVQASIESLAQMGTLSAIQSLIELSVDPMRRESCISALARRGNDGKIDKIEFIQRIRSGLEHQDSIVRCAVIEVLKRLKHPLASAEIMTCLDDLNEGVRLAAINALIYLGNRSCEPLLITLSRSDPSPLVRRCAHKGLILSRQ